MCAGVPSSSDTSTRRELLSTTISKSRPAQQEALAAETNALTCASRPGGMTRGVGWAILFYDKQSGQLLNQWVDEHHLGQLVSTSPILCLDMWEHAYLYDYPTSEKKKYIDAFFENLNWEVIEENFKKAQ